MLDTHEMLTLSGSTGLLRVANATSAPAGTFRVQVLWDYFSGSSFLCDEGTTSKCTTHKNDEASHFGATFAASATVTNFLEGYVAIRSYANSNDQGSPQLLQVLGDTTIGAKVFLPTEPGRLFNVGADLQLLLLNGSGGVGLDGGSTSFRGRLNGTFDFRSPDIGLPLLAHINAGYKFDNSGSIVEDTEAKRGGGPISRIERFGLGINRVDMAEFGVALEGMFNLSDEVRWLRPFVEYTVDVPVNRQNYKCAPNEVWSGDRCLANESTFKAVPSRLTAGVRVNPFLKGLMLTGAVDVGLTGTSVFLEETAPQMPWTLWWGVGYAFDVVERPPVVKNVEIERIVTKAPPTLIVAGKVQEVGTNEAVANAIVRYQGRDITGMVTDANGNFRTGNLEPGSYTFNISADGYKDGVCAVTVAAADTNAQPAAQAAPTAPGLAVTSDPYAPAAATPAPAPAAPATPAAADGTFVSEVSCALESLPKTGNIVGSVVNAEGGAGVSGATVKLIDGAGKERTTQSDGSGHFKFEGLTVGNYKLNATQEAFLGGLAQADVRPRQDVSVTVSMNKRPKVAQVTVGKREITLRQQVHFETGSAKILPDSAVLLEELADVMRRTPKIKKIEIQGHTDNQGTAAFNKTLSDDRARAVRDRLVSLGVEDSRLESKGYGSERPLVPNITANNRARNRRVAIIILEQDK